MSFAAFGARVAFLSVLPALLIAQTPATGVVTGRVLLRADTGSAVAGAGDALARLPVGDVGRVQRVAADQREDAADRAVDDLAHALDT